MKLHLAQVIPHETYMDRALQIAQLGLGSVSSNPMVGCVIVHADTIIGEGYHTALGKPHAEVEAISRVTDESLLRECTLYVTLEPCAHHGRTPPCADLIIESKIPKVVICNTDPFPRVDGRGIQKLKNAGIEVITGVCAKKGRWINRRFFTQHELHRPYIILKWAQTADGYLDHKRAIGSQQNPLKITGPNTDRLVHRWRSEEDAILVGATTALLDNPSLTVRYWKGKQPIRVLIDPQLRCTGNLKLLSDGHKTLILNCVKSKVEGNLEWIQLPTTNMLDAMLKALLERDIQSLMIEGGAYTLNRLIQKQLWDEARILSSAQRIGSGVVAPTLTGTLLSEQRIENDLIQVYSRP